jgi:pilus assembly protein CpaF
VVVIDEDRFTIGKQPGSDLVLDELMISRDHCEIFADSSGKFFLRDKGSRNGTFVGGHRVGADVLLRDGMEVTAGSVTMEFSLDSARAAREPEAAARSAVTGAQRPHWDRAKPTPVSLKTKIHGELVEKLDLKHQDFETQSADEIRAKTIVLIQSIVDGLAPEVPSYVARDVLIKEVADEALGLGPLEDLLADPDVDEIMVNNWDRIYVEIRGKIHKTNLRFTDNQQVMNVIRYAADDVNKAQHAGKDDEIGYGRINMERALVPYKLAR